MIEGENILHRVTVEPIEERVTPEGTSTVVRISGETEEDIATGAQLLSLITDSEIERCDDYDQPSSKFFGFSSSKWNAPWNPKGPEKNWAPPSSQNPQEN